MTWIPGGYNDWFSISLDNSNFELRFNNRANKLYTDFNEAADVAANLLYQQWNDRPLYLALSGGIDSEFVANTFHRNNIPFTPVILKIKGHNDIESWYAEYWCQQHNIPPVILEYSMSMLLDAMAKFFPNLVKIKQHAQTPVLIIYDWVMQQKGYCIYSAGDINLENGKFYCNILDFISTIIYRDRHPTSFFMYTADLALCYVSKFDINLSEQYNKLSFYNVHPRPKIDYVDSIRMVPEYHEHLKKLWYIFKLNEKNFDPYHWYGTKEQIIQNLQP
jgi:hypothetical protein